MDLAVAPEDAELVAVLDALLAKESSPARVRASEGLGFDHELWRSLVAVGVPALAAGADAASVGQLVLVAEQAGRHLASAPVIEALVTTRLLDRCGADATAALSARQNPEAVTTLVLHPCAEPAARLVPAGAVADTLIRFDGDALTAILAQAPQEAAPNLGNLPLADRDLARGEVATVASGERAEQLFRAAQRDWQLLTAAQLVGLAARALEIAVEHVRTRVIFDRPIGSFQTVAHRLADHATAVDGARLLVWEAAWAADQSDARAESLAKMAFCFAAEQALAVAGDSLHYHGGYGFSLEYDIQLYYRRARAYPLVWGSVQREYLALADTVFGKAEVGVPA